MTHNMKTFLELSSEDRTLAARLQMLMLGENGRCNAATEAAVIRLAAEHGLELRSIDFDYMAPDIAARRAPVTECHCFRNGIGTGGDGRRACDCVMYGVGRMGISTRAGSRRQCSCPAAGVGVGG